LRWDLFLQQGHAQERLKALMCGYCLLTGVAGVEMVFDLQCLSLGQLAV
jgi:hypothetical protein